MNTSPYTAQQASLSGAGYTAPSDVRSPVRPVTPPVISGSIERMDSGAGQSIATRDLRKALYAETFNLGLYQHGDTESTIHLPDNKDKKTPCPLTRTSRKPTASSPVSDTIKHEDRSNPLNAPPILAACHYNRVSLSDHLRWVPPLCVAAEEGHEKVVDELLTALGRLPEDKKPYGSIMAVLNSADRWGRTPLHLAVWRGHDKVVAQLLNALDRLPETERCTAFHELWNAKDTHGMTPFESAIQKDDWNILNLRLKFATKLLHLAAKEGRIEHLKLLLLNCPGIRVNSKDDDGCTPLHFAVSGYNGLLSGDYLSCVKELLRVPGIRVNEKDNDGFTPLHFAVHNCYGYDFYSSALCVLLLLRVPGIRVNEKNNDGCTPLYAAAFNGQTTCVTELLNAFGILVNEKNNDGRTPLYAAALNGQAECVKELLNAPGILVNEKDNDGRSPLYAAAFNGQAECVKELLNAPGILVNEKDIAGFTPFCAAAYYGQDECVKELLNAPGILATEKNNAGWTPLYCAARKGWPTCLKLLIANKAIKITLLDAAQNGETKVLADILRPLNRLKEPSKSETIMLVLNVADRDGRTLLCRAAQSGHKKVVDLFLDGLNGLSEDKKAEATISVLSAADRFGRTPFYMAAAFGHDKIITELLAALHRLEYAELPLSLWWAKTGVAIADLVNTADLFGKTPASQARARGHFNIVWILTRAAFPYQVYTVEKDLLSSRCRKVDETGGTQTDLELFNDDLMRLNTLPEAARLNAVMAVLHHAREDELLELDVSGLESYDTLVVKILATMRWLPEAPERVSRNYAILRLIDYICEDGETGPSYTRLARIGQERIAEVLNAFPILSAARNGQTAIVARILKILETWPESERCQAVTTVLTISNKKRQTALHVAAQSDQREVLAQLLNTLVRMAEPERTVAIQKVMHAVDAHGATPLYWAAFNGHHEVVGQLLNTLDRMTEPERTYAIQKVMHGVDDAHGATSLYWAAYNGNHEVVGQLLNVLDRLPEKDRLKAFTPMVNAADQKRATALHWAAYHGDHMVVAQLLNVVGSLPATDKLKAFTTTVNAADQIGATALHWAVFRGQCSVVKQFLNFLNTANNFPEAEKIPAFAAMVCAVDTLNRTPLSAAVDNGQGEIVDQLIQAFPLLDAVLGGHSQSVEQLMQVLTALPREKRGAAIMAVLKQVRPEDGATPLYIAASQGNIEIMKPLLGAVTILLADGNRKGAREVLYSACKVKEEDVEITPLRISAINRHDKAVNLLLEKIRELFIA
ncbi:ankyrin repeat domain-containing protein [Endozoicomonas acroporae]